MLLIQSIRDAFYKTLAVNIPHDHPIFKRMEGPDVNMSAASIGISRVYAKANSLTIFRHRITFDKQVAFDPFIEMQPSYCIPSAFDGKNTHLAHDNWHKNLNDKEEPHGHIVKSTLFPITSKELECMLFFLNRFQRSLGLCETKDTPCFLTREDANRLQKKYDNFYKQSLPVQEELNKLMLQPLYDMLTSTTKTGISIFIYSFTDTLLQNYFKPYLKTHFSSQRNALFRINTDEIINLLNKAIKFVLTNSLLRTMTTSLLEITLKNVLQQSRFTNETINTVVTHLTTVATFIQNPLSILELTLIGNVTFSGQYAAYQLIQSLPKIKLEDRPSATIPEEQSKPMIEAPSRLRHRS